MTSALANRPRSTNPLPTARPSFFLQAKFGNQIDRVSLGEPAKAVEVPKPPGWSLDTETDWKTDGHFVVNGGRTVESSTPLAELDAVTPNNGRAIKGHLIMVNGIMTDVKLQSQDLQELANKGFRVVGVHNATKGMFMDVAQTFGDKLSLTNESNKAIVTVSKLLEESLSNNEPLHLVGHSQGALVLARAIDQVRDKLLSQGNTEEQANAKLSQVHVSSLGGSATTYPEGPSYTHYSNRLDLLSNLAGRGIIGEFFGGEREEMRSFNEFHRPTQLPPWSNGISNRIARIVDRMVHGAQDIYLPKFDAQA